MKAKQEALRRNGGKLILEKLRPESPSSKLKMQKKASLKKIKESMTIKKVQSSSFDPVPIVEAEEMERLNQLKQREFLVRSYGLIEQVCRFHFFRNSGNGMIDADQTRRKHWKFDVTGNS